MAEGAGGDGAEGALGVHDLLPLGQVVRAGQAVGGCSGRPGHHTLGHSIDQALPRDVLLLLSQETCNGSPDEGFSSFLHLRS